MSHTVRRSWNPSGRSTRKISSDDLPTYWSRGRLPTAQEQADNLILWIGDNQPSLGSRAKAPAEVLSAWIGTGLTGGNADLGWVIKQLEGRNDLSVAWGDGTPALMLNMSGWQQYETLKHKQAASRTAFMAMKFGDPTLNDVVERCFKPAIARTGFELRLLTDRQPAGLIDDQMRAAILSARFLIADLTHGSHGAYWEAGFADGLGLPVIYTCEATTWQESKTHFDTNHMVTIVWDTASLAKAGNELTATIRATLRAEAKQTDDR